MKFTPCFAIILLAIFFADRTPVRAQELKLLSFEMKDDKLVVQYSLVDSVVGRFYTVSLYSSKDNFLNPLETVSGDAGLETKPGANNRVVWNARQELGSAFDGKVSLEIRAHVFIPFINTESINQYKVFKRARKYNITWSGGSPQNILNFDLYKGDRKVMSFPNVANVGHHTIEFPGHIKPGSNYRFRISDSKNREDIVYTGKFKIKRKIPLVLKAVPVAIVAAGVSLLLKSKDEEPDLPRPIDN